MDVQIEDISERTAALALQGPTSARLLKTVAEAEITNLKYFRMTSGKIAGVPVDISRTGYTGDLGYEIWVDWKDAVKSGTRSLPREGNLICIPPECWPWMWRGRGGTAVTGCGLHQLAQGADSVAEIFSV